MAERQIRSRRWRRVGGLIFLVLALAFLGVVVWMLLYLARVAGCIAP